MSLIGRFHPLLVHFPIALVLIAAVAELVGVATARPAWRGVALANVRIGAVFAVVTVIAGWMLSTSPIVDATPALEWHRWIGIAGAAGAMGAALMSPAPYIPSRRSVLAYQAALFSSALLVAVAGHLGGTLVWGSRFLLP